jgi:hypothetical protein
MPLGVGLGRGVVVGVAVAVGVPVGVAVAEGVVVGDGVGVAAPAVMLKAPLVEELFWKRLSLAMTRTRTSAMPVDVGNSQS